MMIGALGFMAAHFKKRNDMQSLAKQIEEIHNRVAESQWKIMWGKSIEETAKEIINKCLYGDQEEEE